MLFNSLQFLLFFITVTSLYFAFPPKRRWLLLLVASCWFYIAFIPVYLSILAFTIVIDYFAGILIERSAGRKRKLLLVISIISNIGILCVFKYYNFFTANIEYLLERFHIGGHLPLLDIILPIGLSFHTFQALSYTIEVYRGKQAAERHFGIYALYVMFYPQLVAGPIERPQNMLHQFHSTFEFSRERFREGMLIIGWGLLKKIVVADRLALVVNAVYDQPQGQSAANLVVATVFFAFQIYCDFSAYSEIAYGTAHLMGFKLMENFRTPYFSTSISEFWSRWHISLSTWFRDYLYIPLGGNRVKQMRLYFNLLFVFLVSGLWHGANWGYVIWGGLHGLYLVAALVRKRFLPKLPEAPAVVNMLFVFALSCLAWIFFRAASWYKVMMVLGGFRHGSWHIEGIPVTALLFNIALVGLLFLKEKKYDNYHPRIAGYYLKMAALVALIYFLGVFGGNQFIYFQF